MKHSKIILAVALMFSAGGSVAETSRVDSASGSSTWLVIYSPGPSWVEGKPVSEQGLVDHFHWLLDLYSRGTLHSGGPFTDDSGGMVVMEEVDADSVHELLAGDPAIERGIMQYELRPLRLHPWERFLRQRNERLQDRQGQGRQDGAGDG